jgi:uncharacterized membrane protein SpoIIM required for sporulation
MISTRWLKKRQTHWARLEQLCERSRGRVSALEPVELQELSVLYRQIASDLSTVQEDPSGRNLTAYLNQLLGRAHNLIYMGRRAERIGIVHFYLRQYPAVFRKTIAYSICSLALFLAAGVAAFLVAAQDPAFQRRLIGAEMAETIERRQMWTHSVLTMKPLASSLILTNNLSVSFTAFAGGITGGLATVYVLVLNGILIGVISAACWSAGMSLPLWSFVAPHGALELPAVLIAGAAGLLLGRGLLFPGDLARRESLRQAGSQAVQLVLGVIPLLIIAGVIEGFISPTSLHPGLKFLLGGMLLLLLTAYLVMPSSPKTTAGRAP